MRVRRPSKALRNAVFDSEMGGADVPPSPAEPPPKADPPKRHINELGYCEAGGKVKLSREEATQQAKCLRDKDGYVGRPYRCPHCAAWHVGREKRSYSSARPGKLGKRRFRL